MQRNHTKTQHDAVESDFFPPTYRHYLPIFGCQKMQSCLQRIKNNKTKGTRPSLIGLVADDSNHMNLRLP